MIRAFSRRALVVLALAMAPVFAAAQPLVGDMSLGNPKAKVTVEEYASLSCPHCARFHADVFPAFKKKYIDTGKVRFVMHEFITPPEQPAAAGWLLARCAGPSRYWSVVDAVFRSQTRWTPGGIKALLMDIAKANGLSEPQFNACLADEAAMTALNQRIETAMTAAGVNSTPTFVVNGKKVGEGEMTLKELDAAIAAARRK